MRSWIPSADDLLSDFPLDNLPLGVVASGGRDAPSIGVAIGDRILDLGRCHDQGLLQALPARVADACTASSLNPLMALGRAAGASVREAARTLLAADGTEDHGLRRTVERCLRDAASAELLLPAAIGDFTDFYASMYHARNVANVLRPGAALPPNFPFMPLGYQARTSSIVVSGTTVPRPKGQVKPHGADVPQYVATTRLDYEMEVGFLIGGENRPGTVVPIEAAESRIFGVCLVNDWSARDMQAWESQPLGPFLSKSFATTISPWVVLMDALEPFRAPAFERPPDHPAPLPHLDSADNRRRGAIDVTLELTITSEAMRQAGHAPVRLGRTAFRDHYWNVAQMVTHHASNGCNLRPGDLLASGTVSGSTPEAHGCLLELTRRGDAPVQLPTGESRVFLADGDEIVLRGFCEREGRARIGFGECRGRIAAAGTR